MPGVLHGRKGVLATMEHVRQRDASRVAREVRAFLREGAGSWQALSGVAQPWVADAPLQRSQGPCRYTGCLCDS